MTSFDRARETGLIISLVVDKKIDTIYIRPEPRVARGRRTLAMRK